MNTMTNSSDNQNKDEPKQAELLPMEEQPRQLSFFLDVKDPSHSQSLRLWDSLVNAIFDDRKVVNRVNGKFLETSNTKIEFESQNIDVTRYPARIGKGSEEKEHFPMKKEYKVLEALIKLAVDDNETEFYSSEDAPAYAKTLTIKTTLYRLRNVFRGVTGKATYSFAQLEEALEILSKSHITFKSGDVEINGPLISSFTKDKRQDSNNAEFVVSFHTVISRIVLHGGYREFNLRRALNSPDMFTTFLYKKFVHNFRQASKSNHYHFSMANLLKEVPSISSWKTNTRKVEKISESLEKLTGEVVAKYEVDRRYSQGQGQKKLLDAVFKVWFTDKFISEQIVANKSDKKEKEGVVIGMDGQEVGYPNRKDYQDTTAYLKDLELYHSLSKKEGVAGIVQRIFHNKK
jgi:hypothetical protein